MLQTFNREQLEDRYFQALEDNGVEFLEYEHDENGHFSYVRAEFLYATEEEMMDYIEETTRQMMGTDLILKSTQTE